MSRFSRQVSRGLLALILVTTVVALCPCVPGATSPMDCCPTEGLVVSAMCCPGTGAQTTVVPLSVSIAPPTSPGAVLPSAVDGRLAAGPSFLPVLDRPASARRILRI